jgi:hypothetical protein
MFDLTLRGAFFRRPAALSISTRSRLQQATVPAASDPEPPLLPKKVDRARVLSAVVRLVTIDPRFAAVFLYCGNNQGIAG